MMGPMKKLIPIFLFIMAFTGFLSTQILWDNYHLNAKQLDGDKQKHSLYESNFQTLKLTTVKNSTIELNKLKEPIVILNFWASWCHPCLKEFPSLVKLQEKFKDKVIVVGVNGDEEKPEEAIKKVESKYGLNFESGLDPYGNIADKFLINTYPVSLVFHRGKIIYESRKIHDFMDSDFIKLIEESLK
jgi:thiol-disulfide isomerase/thioredoxin